MGAQPEKRNEDGKLELFQETKKLWPGASKVTKNFLLLLLCNFRRQIEINQVDFELLSKRKFPRTLGAQTNEGCSHTVFPFT